jgi:hypothetical protein
MDRHLAKAACVLGFAVQKARTAIAQAWQAIMPEPASRYRPEAHYMRGPGPKWRAKHASARPWGSRS